MRTCCSGTVRLAVNDVLDAPSTISTNNDPLSNTARRRTNVFSMAPCRPKSLVTAIANVYVGMEWGLQWVKEAGHNSLSHPHQRILLTQLNAARAGQWRRVFLSGNSGVVPRLNCYSYLFLSGNSGVVPTPQHYIHRLQHGSNLPYPSFVQKRLLNG
jgi:hypothetical protein